MTNTVLRGKPGAGNPHVRLEEENLTISGMFLKLRGAVAVVAFIALSHACAGSVVKIEGSPGAWALSVDGKPFFIEGSCGIKSAIARAGGNACRTYDAKDLKAKFAEAGTNSLMVMAGFWLGHMTKSGKGFDYTNAAALEKKDREILEEVERSKNEDRLLCWALGNEMEATNPHREEMWAFIDRVAVKIKAIDPAHPVCTVVAEIPPQTLREFDSLAPHLDFLGINSYGGCTSVASRWRKAGMKRPYVITEFGSRGEWESPKDAATGLPVEQTTTEKGKMYAKSYAVSVTAERDKFCLGSFAYRMRPGDAGMPFGYEMLLEDGSFLAPAEAMQAAWGRKPLVNHCPRTGRISVQEGEAFVQAEDPDNDALTYEWVLYSGVGIPAGERRREKRKKWNGAIIEGQGTPRVRFKLPADGRYRLYCYVRDGKGGAAYANAPVGKAVH